MTSGPPPAAVSWVAWASSLAANNPGAASFGHRRWKTSVAWFPINMRLTGHHASRLDMTWLKCWRARVRRRAMAGSDRRWRRPPVQHLLAFLPPRRWGMHQSNYDGGTRTLGGGRALSQGSLRHVTPRTLHSSNLLNRQPQTSQASNSAFACEMAKPN